MCDGFNDCDDGSDELHDDCKLITEDFKCKRRFGMSDYIRLPLSWTMNGIVDCIGGEDENENIWKRCGNLTENTLRWIYKKEEEGKRGRKNGCSDVFLCSEGDANFVNLDVVCDGVESCGMSLENKICTISRDFPNIRKITSIGMSNEAADLCIVTKTNSKDCVQKEFIGPAGIIFGVSKTLNVPKNKVNCNHLFGEFYVYLSCMDLCINSTCPLPGTPLKYNACPGQYPERIYSLANNTNLTFVTKSRIHKIIKATISSATTHVVWSSARFVILQMTAVTCLTKGTARIMFVVAMMRII